MQINTHRSRLQTDARDAARYYRIQFALTVAFRVTVHKSQGMTVYQAVLNITKKEFVLDFVAASRAKSLCSVLFGSSFDFTRFQGTLLVQRP
jgi:ATP-dependent exoDNAse (exonuclease V) alpha subunit